MFNIKFKFHYLYIENELYLIKIKSKKTNLLWDNTYVTSIYKKRKVSDIM